MNKVQFFLHGALGQITLTNAAGGNALSSATLQELTAALDRAEESTVRSVVLMAEGKHFCTGAELSEVRKYLQDRSAMRSFLALGIEVLERISSFPKPTVAAVQGLCLAGGLELALACDVIIASSVARFGDQHANFGLAPGWNGAVRLTAQIGQRRARELMMLGTMITAEEALQWGLINRIAAPEALRERSMELAQQLAARSRTGLKVMKRLVSDASVTRLDCPSEAVVEQLCSEDAAEGLAAFESRRTPVFP